MNEQDKFDDLMRSKFPEEGDFAFDEGNWEKAEELIDAARRKERSRRWAIIFFAGILLGVIVMIPFFVQKGDKPIPSFAINQKTNINSATSQESKPVTTAETVNTPSENSSELAKT